MGFHKRWINKENIIAYYNRDGMDGLRQLLSADALIVQDNIDTNKIVEYLTNDNEEGIKNMVLELAEERNEDPFSDPDVQDFLERADEQGPWDEEHDKIHTVGGLTNDKETKFMDFQKNMDDNDSKREVE